MSFWNSIKVDKTRKNHTCLYCLNQIPKGSACYHESGKTSEGFHDYRFCVRCHNFIKQFEIDLSDGFDGGEFMTEIHYRSDSLFSCPQSEYHEFEIEDYTDDGKVAICQCFDCGTEFTVDITFPAQPEVEEPKHCHTEAVKCSTCGSERLYTAETHENGNVVLECEVCKKATNILIK